MDKYFKECRKTAYSMKKSQKSRRTSMREEQLWVLGV